MLYRRLTEPPSVCLLLAILLPGAMSLRSFPCSGSLDFSNEDMYCDTQSANKNYLSCAFEVCDGEVASINATSTGADDLLIRIYAAEGQSLQRSNRYHLGESFNALVEFEAPISGLGCTNYEARLGCYDDSTLCSGSLEITADGMLSYAPNVSML